MSLEKLFARVLREPPERINDQTSRSTLKKWDSFHHIRLVTAIEEQYKVKLSIKEIQSFNSVQELRQLLVKKGISGLEGAS